MLKLLGFTIASYCLAMRFLYFAALCVYPYLIYQIEVQTELLIIILVLIHHHPVIGHMYFYKYDCVTSIG